MEIILGQFDTCNVVWYCGIVFAETSLVLISYHIMSGFPRRNKTAIGILLGGAETTIEDIFYVLMSYLSCS